MSQFPTGTTTYSPASLTEQERSDFRTEMGVAKTNGDNSVDFNAKTYNLPANFNTAMHGIDERTTASDIYYENILLEIQGYQGKTFGVRIQHNAYYGNEKEKFIFRLSNSDVCTMRGNGDMLILGSYSPFTGTHIATSNENLKVGELVSLASEGLDEKQPLWHASYCEKSKKGIYGVVYDKLDDKYLIACVGDAIVNFSNENGPCEAGDYLVPSATKKGYAMVYKGDFIPLNQCGKAGEATNENKLIAWVKE